MKPATQTHGLAHSGEIRHPLPDDTARHSAWVNRALRALWMINLATLFVFCIWIATDGLFPFAAHAVGARLLSPFQNWPAAINVSSLRGSLLVLVIGSGACLISLCGIFAALFFGTRDHRRLRSWLAFTAVVAAWLTLLSSWRELAWQGQKWRVARHVAAFETLAASLRKSWPTEDGAHAALGPFMTYPRADPRMLLLLGSSPTHHDKASISAVEKSQTGALRFELSAGEQGAWLEWHPADSQPASFVGGLQGRYDLDRVAPLANGWFLVRYKHLTIEP